VLNNLEFDHADIFPDLAAIERQFHHLVRTVPGEGLILAPAQDAALARVLKMGCWTPVEEFGGAAGWSAHLLEADGSAFAVSWNGTAQGEVRWELLGQHNVSNALAAVGAARHAGVPAAQACAALGEFRSVRRRLELRGVVGEVAVYDDFAHHPTAIATTLAGLRRRVGSARILAVLEPRSNTMRLGVHRDTLAPSLAAADLVFLYHPADLGWDLGAAAASLGERGVVYADIDAIVAAVRAAARPGDHVLVMSNGGFGGIHAKLLAALAE
jgi:UDP-N-acetylmuramate: L-alanyl-gamma-D-glutamyl-meso-diaminopimelate ligase